MNEDTIKGNWKVTKGRIKQAFGDLTDDEVTRAEGDYDELVGLVQKKYGESREEAERRVNELRD